MFAASPLRLNIFPSIYACLWLSPIAISKEEWGERAGERPRERDEHSYIVLIVSVTFLFIFFALCPGPTELHFNQKIHCKVIIPN